MRTSNLTYSTIFNILPTSFTEFQFLLIFLKQGEQMAMNTKETAEIWKEYSDKLLNTEKQLN